MITVFKYPLPTWHGPQEHELPEGAKILCVGPQRAFTYLWAEVDTEKPLEVRRFHLVGTGGELPAGRLTYIGTSIESVFVWHVYEEIA
jgi:hypothetical protein